MDCIKSISISGLLRVYYDPRPHAESLLVMNLTHGQINLTHQLAVALTITFVAMVICSLRVLWCYISMQLLFIFLFFQVLKYLSVRCRPPPKRNGGEGEFIYGAQSVDTFDLNNSTAKCLLVIFFLLETQRAHTVEPTTLDMTILNPQQMVKL